MITTEQHMQQPAASPDFRDRLATMDAKGKRKWIYAKRPAGKYYRWRTYLSWVYFAVFFGLPFVKVNGRPLFLFNIPQARFILFGKLFWPQDFFLLGLGMIAFIFFIILFTAAFGRLFCGWACPQTNFMEMMFRKIEYWIDGDAAQQNALAAAPLNGRKLLKRTVKYTLFYLLSFLIANFFLAYIIGMDALYEIIAGPFSAHVAGFVSLLGFSGVFFAVYAFFREQACTVVCPYGRLQSVLIDRHSMIVAYDHQRGEPRGVDKKNPALKGDCIDCAQCVKVCPTGIDIRNGIQMECVGCTACMDACDAIMVKLHRAEGLIRYASEAGIRHKEPLRYTTRMKLYTAACAAVLVLLATILVTRREVDVTVMRTPGLMYQERGTDSISNLYNIKLANKTNAAIPLTIQLAGNNGRIEMVGKPYVTVAKEGQGSGSFFVVLPKRSIQARKTKLQLVLLDQQGKIATAATTFLAPLNN
jgi:cytochrome c oxidase accessory protein FixG